MPKNKRKRVSRDKVKENAAKGAGSGNDWFSVNEDIGRWSPQKVGRYPIDILPYEVKGKNHPDDIEPGCLWYKLPFAVHHGVGAGNKSMVCPDSMGLRCPICEERNRLYKEDADKYEDLIKDLRPQKFVAYNILDPEDDEKICLFIMSRGKFAATLEQELKDPYNEEHLAFFDITEDGRTLHTRFSEDSFEGKKYLEATKIDFKPRDEMDEDSILDRTVCLEEALVIPSYDILKAMFLQEEDEPESEEETEQEEEKPAKKKPSTKKRKPEPEPEPDDDDGEGDDDDGEGEDDDGEGEDDDGEGEDDDCVACEGTGKSSRGKKCVPCKGTGKKQPVEEPEDDEGEEDDPPPSKAKPAKKEKTSKKKSDTPECPAGGKFGDVDEYDECDDCPLWEQCEEASN